MLDRSLSILSESATIWLGGYCDVYKGSLNDLVVHIKRPRIYRRAGFKVVKKVGRKHHYPSLVAALMKPTGNLS